MSYFPNISEIKYEGPTTSNPFAFKYYNADEVLLGKKMKDHMRFSIAWWHTLTQDGSDQFGDAVNQRSWSNENPLTESLNRVKAGFELFEKLGVEYFCFHDVDIAPQGDSLDEFFSNLDIVTDFIKEEMDRTGIKLLWNTANLFSHPRYLKGAATSPNADVFAYSAAQVKKGLDISKKLQGLNYVFWGGREGYESLLNTDLELEQDNLATFLKMAVDYSEKINHSVQFLIEPKPKEPMKHQYDFDAATTMAFLLKYELADHFKLNLEANHATLAGHTFYHEINVARSFNSLGSLDANQGDLLLGWDTDEFPTNLYDTTLAMSEVINNGGIAPGGINFDSKVRRSSFEMEDLVLAHVAGMDTFARGLRAAVKMKEDQFLENERSSRYASYQSGIGESILSGEETLESLTEHALETPEIKNTSDHLELLKSKLNDYLV